MQAFAFRVLLCAAGGAAVWASCAGCDAQDGDDSMLLYLGVRSQEGGGVGPPLFGAPSLLQAVRASGSLGEAHVVINEVMARPEEGEREYVEVYNPGTQPVDVAGWALRDAAGFSGNWSATTIGAQSVVVVEFSRKLNDRGDTIKLTNADGREVDSFTYTHSSRGQSQSRIPDGGPWSDSPELPTKGALNAAPPAAGVKINEVMAQPVAGAREYVEVYNPGMFPVSISGWTVTDAAGYTATWDDDAAAGVVDAGAVAVAEFLRNRLNNVGDTVTLTDADGNEVDSFTYRTSAAGRSWSRQPDGADWNEEAQAPSRGGLNGLPPTPPPTPVPTPRPPRPQTDTPPCEGTCDDGICFGTWNVQNVGASKGQRPALMEAIRSVVARYDVMAMQELSQYPREPYVCGPYTEDVVCAIRPDPRSYNVSASPRIADEQYVVFTRQGAAEVIGGGATYPDMASIHSRPPHAFNISMTKGDSPWQAVIGVTHTSPERATEEILNFPNVLEWMKGEFPGGGGGAHYMMVGDYNSDGSYFKDHVFWEGSMLHGAFEGYSLLTDNDMDSTVAASSNAYDRIIVDNGLAQEAGTARVFRLEDVDLTQVRAEGCRMGYVPSVFCGADLDGLPWAEVRDHVKTELAKELSDHHPVEVCLRG